jgi:hypothetical protein
MLLWADKPHTVATNPHNMSMLLAFLTLMPLVAALPGCDPSTLSALHAQALSSCGLAPTGSLGELRNPTLFFGPGSSTFCDTECVAAVASLYGPLPHFHITSHCACFATIGVASAEILEG